MVSLRSVRGQAATQTPMPVGTQPHADRPSPFGATSATPQTGSRVRGCHRDVLYYGWHANCPPEQQNPL